MEQRIVDVENVSIKFNLSSEKIDSMKDYLVKRLKGQISFDEFWALQDISFSMNRGDSVDDWIKRMWKKYAFKDNRRSIKTDKGKRKSIWKYCTAY